MFNAALAFDVLAYQYIADDGSEYEYDEERPGRVDCQLMRGYRGRGR